MVIYYVLGKLKGIAHAGIDGNREAIVAASWFEPTHVYIADVIEVMSNEKPISKRTCRAIICIYK